MGRVLTNNVGLSVCIETSLGVAGTTWFTLQPNTIGAFGVQITTRARRPISPNRGRKKGAVVDLDSIVEYEADLTIDQFALFAEAFFFAEYQNLEFDLRDSGGAPTPTSTGYTIDAASALLAGKMQWVTAEHATLVYGKGYATAANNGVKALTADVGSTNTEVTVSGLTAEPSPPANASLQVCGVRGVDIVVNVAADGTGYIESPDISDWASLGIFVGMNLHIGGVDTDSTVTNAPTISATTVYGYVRVTGFDVGNNRVSFDKATSTLLAAGAGTSSAATNDILFGRMVRNVATTADSDDERYLERSLQFEAIYPGLGSGGATRYEYAIGNYASELNLNLALTDLATIGFTFVGTNSDDITASRKSGASSATNPLREVAFGTSADLVSVTTDVISSASDICFKSLTLSVLNNVSPEKCLGTLGATFMNAGLFEVNLEGQMAFVDEAIINAIKNNTTVTFSAVLRNADGALAFDLPEMTLGGGGRDFPVDETVLVNLTGETFTSSTFGHDAAVSILPVVPLAA